MKLLKTSKKRIYLDYAAAAPEKASVRRTASRAAALFGNPSSIHADGLKAARALADARSEIAKVLEAQSDEIIFEGSGTESDNLAVLGAFKHARLSKKFEGKSVHIITTKIEHPAILEACRHIEQVGGEVTYLAVDEGGRIDIKELRSAFRPETVLVTIAYANNEIGVIQPIREIAKEIRHYKKTAGRELHANSYPLFHTDACQAAPYLKLNVAQLGVDLMSFNGSKLGGPRGIAVLYMRRGSPIDPLILGGGQEKGIRSGTENLSGAIGISAALLSAEKNKEHEVSRLTVLRDYFFSEIRKRFPDARINGSLEYRLPGNVHVSFPNIKSELLVLELDARGISASAGSACSSAHDEGSYILEAIYPNGDAEKWGSVRFSMGDATTRADVVKTLAALEAVFDKYTKWKQKA